MFSKSMNKAISSGTTFSSHGEKPRRPSFMIVQVLDHFTHDWCYYMSIIEMSYSSTITVARDRKWFLVAMSISYFMNKVEGLRFTLCSYYGIVYS